MTIHPFAEGVPAALAPVAAPPALVDAVLDAVGLADRYVVRPSPAGPAFVAYNRNGISACELATTMDEATFVTRFRSRFGRPVRLDPAPAAAMVDRIDRALAGRRTALSFDLRSVSEFARAVLTKTAEIPPGEVRPYGWVAAEIGRPRAVRAVGTALGRNPVPLLIPCHRVVRTDGRIGDYAFGSPVKRAVLSAEGVDPDELERLAARRVRYVGSDTTKVFCHPTCSAAKRITDGHRVTFPTATLAAAAGFRACKKCRPTVLEEPAA